MADSPETDAIAKREADGPAADPITTRSTSAIMLISALLLIGVLAWALYDEAYGQRPWKQAQQEFAQRYGRYLNRLKKRGNPTEKEIKESEDYQRLDAEARAARESINPQKQENDRRIKIIEEQLAAVTDPFQDARGRITVINYKVEQADGSAKESLRREVQQRRQEKIKVELPQDDGSGKTTRREFDYQQLEEFYNHLKDEKARLLSDNAELLKEPTELEKKRNDYLRDNMVGLSETQVAALIKKNQ
ncbi:MAG TPA: hypothetical protein VF723_02440, partial [Pyrinomonadaceae bacterium]